MPHFKFLTLRLSIVCLIFNKAMTVSAHLSQHILKKRTVEEDRRSDMNSKGEMKGGEMFLHLSESHKELH